MRSDFCWLLCTCFAIVSLSVMAVPQLAHAVVYDPAPNPIGSANWSATAGFVQSIYSNDSNTDVGNQNPTNVESVLESAAWFDQALTFVGGGACGTSGVTCNESNKSGASTVSANLFAIHFDNKFLALLYANPISSFSISGLPNGVSNIYSFNTLTAIPIPAAFPLLASGIGLLSWLGWRRKHKAVAAA